MKPATVIKRIAKMDPKHARTCLHAIALALWDPADTEWNADTLDAVAFVLRGAASKRLQPRRK